MFADSIRTRLHHISTMTRIRGGKAFPSLQLFLPRIFFFFFFNPCHHNYKNKKASRKLRWQLMMTCFKRGDAAKKPVTQSKNQLLDIVSESLSKMGE